MKYRIFSRTIVQWASLPILFILPVTLKTDVTIQWVDTQMSLKTKHLDAFSIHLKSDTDCRWWIMVLIQSWIASIFILGNFNFLRNIHMSVNLFEWKIKSHSSAFEDVSVGVLSIRRTMALWHEMFCKNAIFRFISSEMKHRLAL